jgi:hypothetical protein
MKRAGAHVLLMLATVVAVVGAIACTPTCPKGKLEAGEKFVRELCALEPLNAIIDLRPGARWAKVDLAAAPITDGIPVFLYADGPEFNAEQVSPERLREMIAEEVDKAKQLAERQDKQWSSVALLAIAADVPVEAIGPVVEMLHKEGFADVALLAEAGGGPAIPPLPVPEVKAEIEARAATIPADQYFPPLEARRQLFEAEIARCPALAHAAENAGRHDYGERCAGFGRDIIAACEQCRCSADVSRALSIGLAFDVPQALRVDKRVTADAPPVTVRAGERWGDVAARVFAAAGPTRLQIEPAG